MSEDVAITITGYAGGETPDHFELKIAVGDEIATVVNVPIATMRRFWSDAGAALADYDEVAGAPSS